MCDMSTLKAAGVGKVYFESFTVSHHELSVKALFNVINTM